MADARLFQQLDRIEKKLDIVDGRLGSIDVTLAGQHEQLIVHIKRTDILERELKPISRHVQQVQGAAKLLGLLALIASIVGGLSVLWSK